MIFKYLKFMLIATFIIILSSSLALGLEETFEGYPTVEVEVNGEIIEYDVPPVLIDGRTMVPFRFIGEAFGAKVGWDSSRRAAMIFTDESHQKPDKYPPSEGKHGQYKELPVVQVEVDNEVIEGDVPGVILEGRTLVPFRFIVEALGYEVGWNSEKGRATAASTETEGIKATYKDLKLAKEEGDEPVYTNTFTTVTPKIYAVGMLENASGTTNLKSDWYYMEEGEEFIDSAEVQTEESSTEFYFNLNKPNEYWPEGTYEVRLFINDEHQDTLEFEIEEAEGSKTTYNDLEMAKLEGEDPVYTDTFSTDTPEIYIVGMLENASGTTNLKSEWYYMVNGKEFIDSAEVQTEETSTEFYFNLIKPDEGWPQGAYEVRLFINDEYQEAVEFYVE